MTKYSQKWRKLLYQLGEEIRKRGTENPKKHGSFWKLVLPNGIIFDHDDFNNHVSVTFPDGSTPWWAGDFGGEAGNATEYDLQQAVDAITLTKYPENHGYILSLKEKLSRAREEYLQALDKEIYLKEKVRTLEKQIEEEEEK